MKTTLNLIRANSPCADGWAKLLKHLGKTQADDEPLSIRQILSSSGLDDALWCLTAVSGRNKEIQLLSVAFARRVQYLMTDPRSLAALDVAERFANGLATLEELGAARDAAEDAEDAAFAAARAPARTAMTNSRTAARTASLAAARAAAWATAWTASAARHTARAASLAAAWDARDAARAAAGAVRDAELVAQTEILLQLCAQCEVASNLGDEVEVPDELR